ncbi:MAG: GNAT family N-acetyltransferase [Cytophagales bacterium]|nr:GNAT family N-acetyltransferase [Cytophagales bacterium]
MTDITIRKGEAQDIIQVFELVKDLATYEKLLHEVELTPAEMLIDGFGEKPLFEVLVAELNYKIVGISLYYFKYSTWKGKRLFLEDIVVKEELRRMGIGTMLFEATKIRAKELNCNGMNWLVLDWNDPAMDFYKKYGAKFEPEWMLATLSKDKL